MVHKYYSWYYFHSWHAEIDTVWKKKLTVQFSLLHIKRNLDSKYKDLTNTLRLKDHYLLN